MKIDGMPTPFTKIEPVIKTPATPGQGIVGTEGKKSFSEHFGEAIKEVDVLQKEADGEIEKLMVGGETVSPHAAMIALEKADMAFQMMNAIRSKIVRAYEEVIRTQV